MELVTKYSDDFKKLYQLYSDFISHTNISSIKSEAEVYKKHFEDSLVAYPLLQEYQKSAGLLKVIDVGTGGGFPTLPLAIVSARENLNLHFTALDSTAKKLKFIEIVKAEFSLQNLSTIAARAEELGALQATVAKDIKGVPQPCLQGALEGRREFYDIALCRSVAHLRIGLELCIPLIKVNGYFLAYKQCEPKTGLVEEPKPISELEEAKSAMKTMGVELLERKVYFNEEREILVFKKLKKTSKLYPRKYSLIKKSPI